MRGGMARWTIALLVAGAAQIACAEGGAVEANAERDDRRTERAEATFAGGCFWCMEPPFDEVDGVLETVVGYTGGAEEHPSYEQVAGGGTGHAEAIRVVYDPRRVSYEELLEVFWRNVDPTVADRQFCDTGRQYRPEIFVHDAGQRAAAERSRERLERTKTFPEPIVVEITDAGAFWRAEAYHQDYYEKNPLRYKYYRFACGRDKRLRQLWGD